MNARASNLVTMASSVLACAAVIATYAEARVAQAATVSPAPGARRALHAPRPFELHFNGKHLTQRTDAALDLAGMFPEHTDVAGGDLRDVPRPDASRRLISAYASERSFAIVSYASDGGAPHCVRRYAERLRRAGFRALPVASDAEPGRALLGFARGDVQLIVHAVEQSGDSVTLTIVRLGPDGEATHGD